MSDKISEKEVISKLDEIYNKYDDKLSDLGISRSDINCFVNDLKCNHGTAQFNRKVPNGEKVEGKYCIRLSEHLKKDGHWEDTLRHELAHVCTHKDVGHKNAKSHGKTWKKWARVLGADPTACKKERPGKIKGDYFVGCPNDCFERSRYRFTKTIHSPKKYRCSECGSPLASWNNGDKRPTKPTCNAEKK